MACLHIRVLGSIVHSSQNPQAHLCISGSVSLPLPPSTCSFFLQKLFVTPLIRHKSKTFLRVCLCAFNRSQAVYKNVERSCGISRETWHECTSTHTHTHKHTDTWVACHKILRRESFCVCADAVMRMTSCVCLCGACTVCSPSALMISSHAHLLNWKTL